MFIPNSSMPRLSVQRQPLQPRTDREWAYTQEQNIEGKKNYGFLFFCPLPYTPQWAVLMKARHRPQHVAFSTRGDQRPQFVSGPTRFGHLTGPTSAQPARIHHATKPGTISTRRLPVGRERLKSIRRRLSGPGLMLAPSHSLLFLSSSSSPPSPSLLTKRCPLPMRERQMKREAPNKNRSQSWALILPATPGGRQRAEKLI